LGNINNVITGLKEAGFILQMDQRTMQLQNKRDLLDRWVDGYRETLKRALHIGDFQFHRPESFTNWKKLTIQKEDTQWGGEGAAEVLTNYLNPGTLTLYTTRIKGELITILKMLPKENGPVKVYQKFWTDPDLRFLKNAKDDTPNMVVPLLLVYADLVITDDPRCLETAEMIFDQYLKDEFK
jgi:hypothetical protein